MTDQEQKAKWFTLAQEWIASDLSIQSFLKHLSRLAQDHLRQPIGNGCCYVFSNRSRTRLKAAPWDGTGVWRPLRVMDYYEHDLAFSSLP
jgi:hypothetical protein